jgi:hypothetical protein
VALSDRPFDSDLLALSDRPFWRYRTGLLTATFVALSDRPFDSDLWGGAIGQDIPSRPDPLPGHMALPAALPESRAPTACRQADGGRLTHSAPDAIGTLSGRYRDAIGTLSDRPFDIARSWHRQAPLPLVPQPGRYREGAIVRRYRVRRYRTGLLTATFGGALWNRPYRPDLSTCAQTSQHAELAA